MVDQLTLQTIGILLTGLTVSIAAIYYTLTLRYTRRNQELQLETRQTQLFTQFMERTSTSEYIETLKEVLSWTWSDFDDFWDKYGEGNIDNWFKMGAVCAPYEHLGILLKEGMIDPMLVWHWGGIIRQLWDKFESITMEYRRRFETPPKGMWWEWFEDLVITLKETREIDIQSFDERLARRKHRREALGMPTY
jgi:hypothetical protein